MTAPRTPALPSTVLGRYEHALWRLPTWVVVTGPVLFAAIAVADVVQGRYVGGALAVAMGLLVLASSAVSRRQGPAVTELTDQGIRAQLPHRRPQLARWDEVRGIRVSSRRNPPQALLTDGGQVQLFGLPDDVARTLASRLPALLGRPVSFEVDDRPVVLVPEGDDRPVISTEDDGERSAGA